MKTIGLLGGMSWESTVPYYRLINQAVRERLGGLHSARVVLHSVDFHEIAELQLAEKWGEAGLVLGASARSVEAAGADGLLICANTMHAVFDQVEASVSIPVLHIADAVAATVREAGHSEVALLGTRFTMERDFYRGRLEQRHELSVRIPDEHDREQIHRVIYDELCHGEIRDESRGVLARIIEGLVARGAEAVILGCTELTMLASPKDEAVPVFDSTEIHARAAVRWALDDAQVR